MPIYSNPKTYLSAGGGDPRDTAIRIEQTVDLTGKVLAVKYFMANGDTVEDSLTYGANSTTEPTVFTRGTLVAAPLPVMLTTFNLSSNGTTFNYTVVGGTVTALGGKLMVGTTNYPLTHVSSGVATISSSIKQGDVVSFTVTSSSPALSTPITNAAVVNNSTQVTPTLVLSGWSVASDGVTVNYTATGGVVTALAGSLSVAGLPRVLTHISSGVASIAVKANTGEAITVTLTSASPTLATAVSGATVTNNSTQTSGLVKQTLTWTGANVTVSGDTVSSTVGYSQALASAVINSALPFEVSGIQTFHTSDSSNNFAWILLDNDRLALNNWGGTANNIVVGTTALGTDTFRFANTTFANAGATVNNAAYKFVGDGAGNVVHSVKKDGTNWVVLQTITGVTGNLAIKFHAAGGGGATFTSTIALYV